MVDVDKTIHDALTAIIDAERELRSRGAALAAATDVKTLAENAHRKAESALVAVKVKLHQLLRDEVDKPAESDATADDGKHAATVTTTEAAGVAADMTLSALESGANVVAAKSVKPKADE